MSFVNDLRKKPDAVKQRIAFGTAFVTVGIIALIWVISLPARFADGAVVVAPEVDAEDGSQFGASVGGAFSGMKEQFGDFFAGFNQEEAIAPEENEGETASTSEPEVESTQGAGSAQNSESTASSTPPTVASPSENERVILIGTSTKKSEQKSQ